MCNLINFECDGDKESINDDIFKNGFLRTTQYHDTTEFEDILVWGICNEIKAYVWLLHNLKKNPTIEFSINDNLETFNLNNVIYNTHVKFTSKNNYFNLLINLKIKVSEEDKEFLNIKGLEDLNIEKKFNHIGWFDDENSKEVEDMYLDSFNTDKYKINVPRTQLTGAW